MNGYRGQLVDHLYLRCPALRRSIKAEQRLPEPQRYAGRDVVGIDIDPGADGFVCAWCLRVARKAAA